MRPEFGYRFITDELAEAGIIAGRKRVNRLCTTQRLWSVHSRKRGLNRRPGPPVHDDLVERHFTAERPNHLWLTDITEHPTGEGKLYLAAVKDACSNRIVGYSMNQRMTSQLAVDALTNACSLRRPIGTTVHSDRGSQFRSHAFVRALRDYGLNGSMGRVGACADNAAMESFFSLLQKNVLNRRRWQTREQLRLAIITWIEKTYHRRTTTRQPRSTHTHRVRDTPTSRSRGLTAPTRTSQPNRGQTHAQVSRSGDTEMTSESGHRPTRRHWPRSSSSSRRCEHTAYF